ncbi:unnamed protein product [Phaeothamnion confervicola]
MSAPLGGSSCSSGGSALLPSTWLRRSPPPPSLVSPPATPLPTLFGVFSSLLARRGNGCGGHYRCRTICFGGHGKQQTLAVECVEWGLAFRRLPRAGFITVGNLFAVFVIKKRAGIAEAQFYLRSVSCLPT